ncbi:MAG TPA: hypothetical protein ENK68_02470 [Epsilonproteobacteria bacterium]|nr:hypothetical protein [Campylobacterota bacterium]
MKTFKQKVVLLGSGILLSSSLEAFDNNREGFFVSLGAGVSQTSHRPYESSNSHTGFGTSQKIGYGLTNQWIVHLTREDSWFKYDSDQYVSCVLGFGATYYLSENKGSLFFSASLGAGSFNNIDTDKNKFGPGVSLSVGYEMLEHLNAEITFMAADVEIDDKQVDPATFKMGISYSWY